MHPGTNVRALAVFAIALSPTLLAAQQSGVLRGTVSDTAGRVIPGAVVRVTAARLGAFVDSA